MTRAQIGCQAMCCNFVDEYSLGWIIDMIRNLSYDHPRRKTIVSFDNEEIFYMISKITRIMAMTSIWGGYYFALTLSSSPPFFGGRGILPCGERAPILSVRCEWRTLHLDYSRELIRELKTSSHNKAIRQVLLPHVGGGFLPCRDTNHLRKRRIFRKLQTYAHTHDIICIFDFNS